MCVSELPQSGVEQGNLHLLLPNLVEWLVKYLVELRGMSVPQAIVEIYTSQMYAKLEVEETKLWHLGPVALYEMLCDEKGWNRD